MQIKVTDIIYRIDEILRNRRDEPIDMLGSYIVGATLVRDDIDEFYEKYPMLEELAELGAELETLGDTELAKNVLQEITVKFNILKEQVNNETL